MGATTTRVYPVIHVAGTAQVVQQVRVAFAHEVAGVFLIDHDSDDARLMDSISAVRDIYPDAFLGVNFIHRSAATALHILAGRFGDDIPLNAIWSDNAGLSLTDAPEGGVGEEVTALAAARTHTGWQGLHFGGVAFKYQVPVPPAQLPALGRLARQYVDVPTTSGPGTGQAVDVTRLRALREGLGDHPLALASGVTPANVADFVEFVDHILVSTGINNRADLIEETKLVELLSKVQAP